MARARSRYGMCVAALGAILLGASVFMPWYSAAPRAHVDIQGVVQGIAVSRLSEVDAWRGLPQLTVVLLVVAVLALLDVLVPLARVRGGVAGGAGGALVLVGTVGAVCTLFRMVDPPAWGGLITPSLREGAWLALIGACAVVIGGMWPRHALRHAFGHEFGREFGHELETELRPLAPRTLSWH